MDYIGFWLLANLQEKQFLREQQQSANVCCCSSRVLGIVAYGKKMGVLQTWSVSENNACTTG
jgi:hypothetical protein